ncbi:MAG: aryl-sulfate sulfotransferase [Lachnospiraceae bacterium]|nr:aryl-sulfate sulfotransferase [Lachnospiraceae bacterium]
MSGKLTTLSGRIKEWTQFHFSSYKIDFMSLNRLRLNLNISGGLPNRTPYTELTREKEQKLHDLLQDESLTFDTMKIVTNPYGLAPLTAMAVFHTETPCCLSYTVKGTSSDTDYHHTFTEPVTTHIAPIFGLYPDTDNILTLELITEDTVTASRTIRIKTGPLPHPLADNPDGSFYPFWRDCEGTIRYFLNVPASDAGLTAISDNRFLMADAAIRTRTGQFPLPTHLYEFDLLGRFYRTFYIGSGIDAICEEKEPSGNLNIVTSPHLREAENTLLELERQTGAVAKSSALSDALKNDTIHTGTVLDRSYLDALSTETLEAFYRLERSLADIPYAVCGWLPAPTLYKGASIQTAAAVSLEYMAEHYDMRFAISGDALYLTTTGSQLLEILFTKYDRIYQLDLSGLPPEDDRYANYSYTMAVPFTEMHSGTYSIILRFVDGGQEVLADTVTLSRTRQ